MAQILREQLNGLKHKEQRKKIMSLRVQLSFGFGLGMPVSAEPAFEYNTEQLLTSEFENCSCNISTH